MEGNNSRREQDDFHHHADEVQQYVQDESAIGQGFQDDTSNTSFRQTIMGPPPLPGRLQPTGASNYAYLPQEHAAVYDLQPTESSLPFQTSYGGDQRLATSFSAYSITGSGYNVNLNPSSAQQLPTSMYATQGDYSRRYSLPMELEPHQQEALAADAYLQNPTMSHLSQSHMYAAAPSLNIPVAEARPDPHRSLNDTQEGSLHDRAFEAYSDDLFEVYRLILDGALVRASRLLRRVTEWLLSNIEELGLLNDDEEREPERLELWRNFNNAWLAFFQKQLDMSEDLIDIGVSPLHSQEVLKYEELDEMRGELVQKCDEIQSFGLVDYEMGILEKDIIAISEKCLDLMEDAEKQERVRRQGAAYLEEAEASSSRQA